MLCGKIATTHTRFMTRSVVRQLPFSYESAEMLHAVAAVGVCLRECEYGIITGTESLCEFSNVCRGELCKRWLCIAFNQLRRFSLPSLNEGREILRVDRRFPLKLEH